MKVNGTHLEGTIVHANEDAVGVDNYEITCTAAPYAPVLFLWKII